MQIRIGYKLTYRHPAPTPMLVMATVHHSRIADIITPDRFQASPAVPTTPYYDAFGNWCTRLVAPAGEIRLSTDALVNDSGVPDEVNWDAQQHEIQDLPAETIVYLLGSRYCETDKLSPIAWDLFGNTPKGWPRLQAILDFVHNHVTFGYEFARSTKSAYDVFEERRGVCRDFAHLAVALCRCMNIPARYTTGYLGDIGVPPSETPMDFSGWFEAYLGGRWYSCDARHNHPRIGRIPIAYGRDATDVAISISFGASDLIGFEVTTYEVPGDEVEEQVAASAHAAGPSAHEASAGVEQITVGTR